MRGTVISVRPILERGRLRAHVHVRMSYDFYETANLSQVAMDAILPRDVLIGGARSVEWSQIESTLQPILARMVEGRIVEVRYHGQKKTATFSQWRDVTFTHGGK